MDKIRPADEALFVVTRNTDPGPVIRVQWPGDRQFLCLAVKSPGQRQDRPDMPDANKGFEFFDDVPGRAESYPFKLLTKQNWRGSEIVYEDSLDAAFASFWKRHHIMAHRITHQD